MTPTETLARLFLQEIAHGHGIAPGYAVVKDCCFYCGAEVDRWIDKDRPVVDHQDDCLLTRVRAFLKTS